MQSKSFLLLMAVLLVAAGGVWWLDQQQASQEDAPLFAGLGMESINQTQKITITGASDKVANIVKDKEGQWGVIEEGGYPADRVKIRKLLIALSEAKRMEFKTDRSDQFAILGVADPSAEGEGAGVQVEIMTANKSFQLVAGNTPESFKDSQYIRILPRNEVWMINRQLELSDKSSEWLDREIMNIPSAATHEVLLTASGKEEIKIARADRGGEAKLVTLPAGRKQKPSPYFNSIMGASEELEFAEIIEKDKDYKVPKLAIVVTYTTFDGLQMKYAVYKVADNTYADFSVMIDETVVNEFTESAAGARQSLRKEVEHLSKRFKRWYYKVKDPTYQGLVTDLYQITEEIEKEKEEDKSGKKVDDKSDKAFQ